MAFLQESGKEQKLLERFWTYSISHETIKKSIKSWFFFALQGGKDYAYFILYWKRMTFCAFNYFSLYCILMK